ncbi:polysaccharide pyruvyl transferase family protein [Pseudarthrobacter sp. J75]|uniref:polysaccharide pyruvyl transferase family protein n=1 Tax=Pseudarthrobacter sp. J75 TaxID=3116486 RepID=UPI002E801B32|nr:polysaccharide pyruvyl transferase family protein [Pseudarthrobacter sp. J75]MEE2528805.1 polysaccharide pyruvyl transferase family protein [Pseudarthrobacter sp. J75]
MARIGLVGFFGWGNYGDELFYRIWKQSVGQFHETRLLHDKLESPYFSRPAAEVVRDVDGIIIGGGDLVIPNKISPLYWNRAWLAKPIYISGVGVPTWIKHEAPDVMERLRTFFQHPNVRYISARDVESAEWIRRKLQPKVAVEHHADLAFGSMYPPARKFEKPTVGISLRTHRADSDPTILLNACRQLQSEGFEILNIVMGTGRTRAADLAVAQAFPLEGQKIFESESIDDISSVIGGLDVLISNKFHGTVVATTYGVSSVVLSSTSKSRNIYKRLGRTPLLSSAVDEQLLDKVRLAKMPLAPDVLQAVRLEAYEGVHKVARAINADFPALS